MVGVDRLITCQNFISFTTSYSKSAWHSIITSRSSLASLRGVPTPPATTSLCLEGTLSHILIKSRSYSAPSSGMEASVGAGRTYNPKSIWINHSMRTCLCTLDFPGILKDFHIRPSKGSIDFDSTIQMSFSHSSTLPPLVRLPRHDTHGDL